MKLKLTVTCFFFLSFIFQSFSQDVYVCDRVFSADGSNSIEAYVRPSTVTAIDLLGYKLPGDGGGGRFSWIAGSIPSGAPTPARGSVFVAAASGSSGTGYWKRDITDNTVNVVWFDVQTSTSASAATSTIRANNSNGINDAIETGYFLLQNTATFPTTNSKNTFRIYVPGNKYSYYVANSITLERGMEFYGDNTYWGNQTEIRTPVGSTGMIVKAAPYFIQTVTVHDIALVYGDVLNDPNYEAEDGTIHGIDASTIVYLENVTARGYPGDGFHLYATKTTENASVDVSFSRIMNCRSVHNSRHGFYIGGADANGCTVQNTESRSNKVFGYYEVSAFGNNYVSAASQNNGPGMDTSNTTTGGGFYVGGSSNKSSFVGCYMEAADRRSENTSPSVIINGPGFTAASFDKSPVPRLSATNRLEVLIAPGLTVKGEIVDSTHTGYESYDIIAKPTIRYAPGSERGLGINIPGESNYTLGINELGTYNLAADRFVMFQRNQDRYQTAFAIAKSTSNPDFFGRTLNTSTQGKIAFPSGIYLRAYTTEGTFTSPITGAFYNQHRLFAMSTRIPQTSPVNVAEFDNKEYAAGDFLLNNNPANGSIIGWRCVTGGTSGTWQELRASTLNTAQNGLSMVSNNIELGGSALLHNTDIDLSTYNLNLTAGGTNKISFSNNTTAGGIISLNANRFIYAFGTGNSFVGQNSGNLTTTGINNTSLGFETNYSLTTGNANTAIGSGALKLCTSGSANTSIGWGAMAVTTTGKENVAVGGQALAANTTGDFNISMGRQALLANTTGWGNTALGAHSVKAYTTGVLNIGIGMYAGNQPTSGNYNVYIGAYAGPATNTNSAFTKSSMLYINSASANNNSPLIGGDFNLRKVSVNKDLTAGNLYYTFDVNGTGRFASSAIIGTDAYPNSNFAAAQALGYNLLVKGKILSEAFDVSLYSAWPDYVFEKEYELRTLSDVEKYINEHKHLPGIASAAQVKKKSSFSLGDMTVTLLEKVEELTLYAIDADKKLSQSQDKIQELESRLLKLEQMVSAKK